MKNVNTLVSVSLIVLAVSACNDGTVPVAVSGSSSYTGSSSNTSGSGGVNCGTTSDGSGNLTLTCDNGMTVTAPASAMTQFKGAAGAAGAQGIQGTTGPAGAQGVRGLPGVDGVSAQRTKLVDANGIVMSDLVVSYYINVTPFVTVFDSTNKVLATYNSVGTLYSPYENLTLYYLVPGCVGAAFIAGGSPPDGVLFKTNNSLYYTSYDPNYTNTISSYSQRSGTTGVCSGSSGSAVNGVSKAIPYNGSFTGTIGTHWKIDLQ